MPTRASDIVELTGQVHDQLISETFIISQLKKDAIMGMPFLKGHGERKTRKKFLTAIKVVKQFRPYLY